MSHDLMSFTKGTCIVFSQGYCLFVFSLLCWIVNFVSYLPLPVGLEISQLCKFADLLTPWNSWIFKRALVTLPKEQSSWGLSASTFMIEFYVAIPLPQRHVDGNARTLIKINEAASELMCQTMSLRWEVSLCAHMQQKPTHPPGGGGLQMTSYPAKHSMPGREQTDWNPRPMTWGHVAVALTRAWQRHVGLSHRMGRSLWSLSLETGRSLPISSVLRHVIVASCWHVTVCIIKNSFHLLFLL